MTAISPVEKTPIAKYLLENKARPRHSRCEMNTIEFYNKNNDCIGKMKKDSDQYSTELNISLYEPGEDTPFIKSVISIYKKGFKCIFDGISGIDIPFRIETFKSFIDKRNNYTDNKKSITEVSKDIKFEQVTEPPHLKELLRIPEYYPLFKTNKPIKYVKTSAT